ncbi:hypothetical protein TPHA_0B01870 [Tetrapisispora phaffii CBS 4417]|uniref:Autophagy-related protein 17 n=1 Tax=Tetrapisispora phaffii (strain ATCC 24235 / CBS 4417 / NBRC 1672 / NRRL Y-8282 / UCD 70-5) TaxID=1071381 RepID=G8BPC8_TETPH|nr:hypothetical protein TPHA_0B01870 [Tetrapisispora phaffii CBS 4417]CCE61859.1 hypothetical protein TPHA_0B01870 [Tetrapisispora phaffii CBS 4417]
MSSQDYLNNARKSLVEAQVVSQETNINIKNIKDRLTELEKSIGKGKFIRKSLEKQVQFLRNNILRDFIERRLINKEWSQVILIDMVRDLHHWNALIRNQAEVLENTKNVLNDPSKKTFDNEFQTLGSFISQDNLNILEARLNEIPNIELHIDTIKHQYQIMVNKIDTELIKKDMQDLFLKFEKTFDQDSDEMQKLLLKYPTELKELECDIVNYLSSLTHHYEQCQLLCDIDEFSPDFKELSEIIKADNNELHIISESLEETVKNINGRINSVSKLLANKEKESLEYKKLFKDLLKKFKTNHEYLLIFKEIAEIIEKFKNTCIQDMSYIEDLYHFYQNFESSYQNMLQEINRRKQVAKEMQKILDDCESQLKALSLKDKVCREQFLNENGKYLPENILPAEMQSSKPLYSLEYSINKY